MKIEDFQHKYKDKKVAIAHEYLLKMGGAERLVKNMLEIFPQADVFTLAYDEKIVASDFAGHKIVGSALMKLPGFIRRFRRVFFPFFPRLVERWDFSDYDLVISSSSAYMHGVVTNLKTKHLCYYHSPTRYLWDWHFNYLRELNLFWPISNYVKRLLDKQREWDFLASQRPEKILANSKYIKGRISKFYRRDSDVLYPPIELDRFELNKDKSDYYLYVGSLSPYKNVELAVRYFTTTNKKFIVVGNGKEIDNLQKIAGPNVSFVSNANNDDVTTYMQKAKGFVFPGVEDFGMVMVEALASGTPVFANAEGGAAEIVEHGKTGWLIKNPNLKSFTEEFTKFEDNLENFVQNISVGKTAQFSKQNFLEKLADHSAQLFESTN